MIALAARTPVNFTYDLLYHMLASGPPICLPAPKIAGLLMPPRALEPERATAPVPTLFEYGNVRLAKLDKPIRQQLTVAVERLLDGVLLYLLGEQDRPAFAAAETRFFRTVHSLHRGGLDTPPPARSRIDILNRPAPIIDHRDRFAILLRAMLHINLTPADDFIDVDGYRYQFKTWYAGDCLIVRRRAPDGRTWVSSQPIFKEADLDGARREVDLHFERAVQGAAWRLENDAPASGATSTVRQRAEDKIDQANEQIREAVWPYLEGALRVRQQHQQQ